LLAMSKKKARQKRGTLFMSISVGFL
jgi:hypothetical protein